MKIINTNTLNSTDWMSFKNKTFIDKNGHEKNWTYIERRNNTKAAVIIAKDTRKQKIVLIKQLRVPFEKYVIEFPAGLIDDGETPEQAALRELKEETGYSASITKKTSPVLCTSPGLTTEAAYIIEAEIDSEETQTPATEGSEDIEVFLIDINKLNTELEKFAENGCIIDSKVWSYAVNY